MNILQQLIEHGYSERTAKDIMNRYANERNWSGLELFVESLNPFYNDHKEYPKED